MRRLLDTIVALMILMLLMPLLLAITLAILVSSGEPFYRGWRVGQGGKSFRMWKFRTMAPNAARTGLPITSNKDPRVTRLGRLLRKTKLDELPQFLNVVAGDMALVGPRPEAPEIVALYSERQRAVLALKPGVTGPVQVRWADESDSIPQGNSGLRYYIEQLIDRKLSIDLDYAARRTIWSDARIVLETAVLILRRLTYTAVLASQSGNGWQTPE